MVKMLGTLAFVCMTAALVMMDVEADHSFVIDLDNNTFLKDGIPFQYMSGSIHYFRVPYDYWADRLKKMFAAGLDAAQTYVAWNLHEPMPGVYDFEGQQDLGLFLQTAQDAGLLVILRAGPYICGEWEYGGLPAWLLSTNDSMTVRTMNASYINAVDRWMGVLLPKIKPFLYSNGGPVIMVQVENEYGSYRGIDCGHDYMSHLRDLFRKHLGNDVVLFTTDGNDYGLMTCGAIDGVYGTVDFGPDQSTAAAFAAMRKWNPKGPLVNSESYTGWLDYWGGGHAHGDTQQIVNSLKSIRAYGASVSMYMFEGGTSFGFMNGADPTFSVCPTSYDYDSPLTEAGDITDKYLAIRNFTMTYKKLPAVPPNLPKFAYGEVPMMKMDTVLDLLKSVSPGAPFSSIYPLSVEQANYFYGFVLYRHVLTASYGSAVLSTPGLRDRGYVLVDGVPRGMVYRNGDTSFNIFVRSGQVLDIIVENMGRLNYGGAINDNKKGMISNVTLNGQILSGWSMYALDFNNLFNNLVDKHLKFRPSSATDVQLPYQPTVYTGQFVVPQLIPQPQDSFLKVCGWTKGQAYINGFNLGRYWPTLGPQVTLYVPAGLLYPSPKPNIVILVELEASPSTSTGQAADDVIEFVSAPIINSRCFNRSTAETLEPSTAFHRRRRY